MRNVGREGAGLVVLAGMLAGCSAGLCDRASVERAFASAGPGDTVELGACEIEGPLRVPPGVQLAGTEGTVVVAPPESAAIVALGATPATVVRDLEVRVEGRIGILVRGGGDARIERLRVDARRGIGLGMSELASLELVDVTVSGPVRAENAEDPRWVRVATAPAPRGPCPDPSDCDCEPGAIDEPAELVCDASGHWATWTATYGLVLAAVERATLTNVQVEGFAAWGALFFDSTVEWRAGGVCDTIGIGIHQVRGALHVEDLAAERTYASLRGTRPYAILTSGGRLEGRRLDVRDNDRFGVLVHEGSGQLLDLVAERNRDAALWIARSEGFELAGAGTRLEENAFAGVVVTSSSGVRIADGTIRSTREQERAVGMLGVLRVGDGVHVVGSTGEVTLADLALSDNGRAGIVADLGAGSVSFSGVRVDGSGAQLGAIAGTPDGAGRLSAGAAAGWDAGITRSGAAEANDAAFSGSLHAVTEPLPGPVPDPGNVLGVVAPMF